QERNEWWGEPRSLREYIMRLFIGGQKMLWTDTPTSKGLAHHLGLKGKESDRRKFFGLLGSEGKTNAMTPEALGHRVWEDVVSRGDEGESGIFFLGYDSMEVFTEILDVLYTYYSKAQLINA